MLTSIVVNFDSASFVRRLLSSGGLAGTSVIVVDNGSEPEKVTELCAQFSATPLLLPANVGFAAGVNAALRALPADVEEVLLVNPDVTIKADAVAALRDALYRLRADAVCPLILVEGTTEVQGGNGGGPLTLWSLAAYYWCLARLFPRTRGLFLNRPQIRALSGPTRLDWLSMGCVLMRRDAFVRYGLLPEDELMYGEDIAWGTRASDAGARLLLVPSITVEHLGGASGGSSYAASLWPLSRLIARRMPPLRAKIGRLILSTGLRARVLAGLPVAAPARSTR